MKKRFQYSDNYGTYITLDATFTPTTEEYGTVTGIIEEGTTTSRIFQHTSTRSNVGEHLEVTGVSKSEWAEGYKRCSTCG